MFILVPALESPISFRPPLWKKESFFFLSRGQDTFRSVRLGLSTAET